MAKVSLRPLDVCDLDRTRAWIHQIEVHDNLILSSKAGTDQASWFEQYEKDSTKQVYAIEVSGLHVGNISLFHIDPVHSRAQISIFIGDPRWRGQGIGSAALRNAFELAFYKLGLEKVFLEVLADNAAAINTYRKVGMTEEGFLRSHALVCGRRRDLLVFSILRQETLANPA